MGGTMKFGKRPATSLLRNRTTFIIPAFFCAFFLAIFCSVIDGTFDDDGFESITLIANGSAWDASPVIDQLTSTLSQPVFAGRADTRAGFWYRLGTGPY